MRFVPFAGSVAAWTPAKVNLFLEVPRQRPDGYHDIATLMLAVNLYDTLVFRAAPQGVLDLQCDRPELSCGSENLVIRAAQLLRQETGCYQGAALRLVKRIPMQAGLGGGSSDAAAALLGLDRLWNLNLSPERLAELGGRLGSDVAFFVKAEAAWCTGRGEVVEPWPVGRRLHLVLVCPPFGLPTPAVYRGLTVPANPVDGATLQEAVREGDIDAIGRGLHNRLYESALTLAPRLADYLNKLRNLGPAGVLMSGSGSTVFALCRGRDQAKELARAYARGPVGPSDKVYVVRSCASRLSF